MCEGGTEALTVSYATFSGSTGPPLLLRYVGRRFSRQKARLNVLNRTEDLAALVHPSPGVSRAPLARSAVPVGGGL